MLALAAERSDLEFVWFFAALDDSKVTKHDICGGLSVVFVVFGCSFGIPSSAQGNAVLQFV
jgi:hypothetical protein